MGRATNELGYHPRALLVRQLSRIACDIPHFSYLHYVSGNRQDSSVGLQRLPLVNQCGLSPDLPNDF
jgi:hypothetical protein